MGGWTWGNNWAVANGWDAINQPAGGGNFVGNGPWLVQEHDVTNPGWMTSYKALAKAPGGSAFPSSGLSAFTIRVTGRAAKWHLSSRSAPWNPPVRPGYSGDAAAQNDLTVKASEFVTQGSVGGSEFVYEIPFPAAIGKLGSCRWDREIYITPYDENGKKGTSTCIHRFHTFSPLVLDFESKGMLETVNPIASKAKFDLDGNGIPEKTGWVASRTAGMLALDLDENGVIDDGRELFGEATKLPSGSRAKNGYLALAQYDNGRKGYIDSTDAIFHKVVVWFDVNGDGISGRHELRHLADLGVTRIAVKYGNVATNLNIR